MSDFELPTGIGATLRNPWATYVRVADDEWMCTEHVLADILPDVLKNDPVTNELMLGYRGEWQVVTEGVEL